MNLKSDVKLNRTGTAERENTMYVVDILMATYNGENFIREQVDSIMRQTWKNWRLIIRDDGSHDGTVNLIRELGAGDGRVIFVDDDRGNLGYNNNFLRLLSISQANYIMFCDQDDIWLPTKIEESMSVMKKMESKYGDAPCLVHCDAAIVDAEAKIVRSRFIGGRGKKEGISGVLMSNCVQGAASLINNSLKRHLLKSKSALPYDYQAALIAGFVGFRCYINKALLLYRQHNNNVIGSGAPRKGQLKTKGLFSYFPSLKLTIDVQPEVSNIYLCCADEVRGGAAIEYSEYLYIFKGRSLFRRFFLIIKNKYFYYSRRDVIGLLFYVFMNKFCCFRRGFV